MKRFAGKELSKLWKTSGITYADKMLLQEKKAKQLYRLGVKDWLLGSGLCINLKDIEKVPAFYNPPNARGEDTFFSTLLSNAKVVRVPTYHFHDGFLKYTEIMEGKYPKELNKIELDEAVQKRFFEACIGWVKYKPLLIYITSREKYEEKIRQTYRKLDSSIHTMNKLYKNYDFSQLLKVLEEYNANVRKHYREYIRINNIWNKIKLKMKEENK